MTTLQSWAHQRAMELPGADMSHPFGEEWDVYKVRDKVFMLCSVVRGAEIVTLKARPDDSRSLRDAFPEITPGYHMNKRHWITINPGGTIEADLVAELVTESYLLVLEKNVPQYRWPLGVEALGM